MTGLRLLLKRPPASRQASNGYGGAASGQPARGAGNHDAPSTCSWNQRNYRKGPISSLEQLPGERRSIRGGIGSAGEQEAPRCAADRHVPMSSPTPRHDWLPTRDACRSLHVSRLQLLEQKKLGIFESGKHYYFASPNGRRSKLVWNVPLVRQFHLLRVS